MKKVRKLGYVIFLICCSLWGVPYTDNGNGTITDSATGLIWQKCSVGLGTTLGICSTGNISQLDWFTAISYCEGLNLGGRIDWRLPNINELGSIIDYSISSGPVIDSSAFPNTRRYLYWSSSTYSSTFGTRVWYINFDTGWSNVDYASSTIHVRCVTGP